MRERRRWRNLLLILGLCMPLAAQAQTQEEEDEFQRAEQDIRSIDTAHDKIIKLHPLQLGEIYLAYEKMRTSRVSSEIGIGYVYSSYLGGSEWLPSPKSTSGVAIRMSQRHYTSKKHTRPFGFFHGPEFGYKFLLFEERALGIPQNASTRHVGRLYQNSLELNYQLGGQFKLGRHITFEVAGLLGARLKYARARNGGEELYNSIIGHILKYDENSVLAVVPSPQLKLSVGYSF